METYWLKSGNKEMSKYILTFWISPIVNKRLDNELESYFAKTSEPEAAPKVWLNSALSNYKST